jgi:MtfA peptidase
MSSLLARWQRWREDRAVARRPIAPDLWRRTLKRYPFLQTHQADDDARLKRLASRFLDAKEFTAVGDVKLSNDVVVAVAAQACLPILRLGLERYDGFVGIVLHADQVVARREHHDDDGVVHEYDEVVSGEAMSGGPLMLSWRDVRAAGMSAAVGYNVVIHEFAHVLDMADGLADGVPLLPPGMSREAWLLVLSQAREELERREAAGEDHALDTYGLQGADEFFAVATEAFFVSPQRMKKEHPALYQILCDFYLQDPAALAD